ncbi:MFS transporter [Stigmatella erecta]|uniref:MFS transporter n=1 Tax=Stigmatella erecta TaxID=83460 RepID=UPI0015A5E96E|nr:MFS transporter [Stigmatella erecta]
MSTSFFASLSLFMVIPFLTIHLTSLGVMTLEQAGVVVGISFWIKRGGAFFGGLAADRFGRRPLMVLALAMRVPGYVLLAYGRTFPSLLLANILIAAGSAFYMPAAKSALTLLAPAEHRMRIFALRAGVVNTGAAIGPFAGAALLTHSPELMFLAAAAAFLGLTVANAVLRFPDGARASRSSLNLALEVAKSPYLLRMMLFGLLFFLVYIQTETIFPVLVKDAGHADKIGLLFGCWAALVVVSQIALSRLVLTMPRSVCLLLGFAGFSLGFLILHAASRSGGGASLFGLVPLVPGFFLAIALFSVAEVMLDLRLDYDTSLVPADRVGTSFGFINLACGLGGLIGSSVGTFAYETLGGPGEMPGSVWMLMAVLAGLSALVLMRQRHGEPTPDVQKPL